ncbi:hypothetical protein ACV1C4_21990 [Aeromonas hydrophila]
MNWVEPLGLAGCGANESFIFFNKTHKDSLPKPKPKETSPNGGRLQSHHGLQQEWAIHNLSGHGYNPKLAPSITLETGKGLPHTGISNAQNMRLDLRVANGNGKWSSSLQDELGNISSNLKSAGFSNDTIQKVIEQQYKMLDKLNVPYDRINIL